MSTGISPLVLVLLSTARAADQHGSNITLGSTQITLHSSSLVRFQWSAKASWEERPSLVAVNRSVGTHTQFKQTDSAGVTTITTATLQIQLNAHHCKEGLRASGCLSIWFPFYEVASSTSATVRKWSPTDYTNLTGPGNLKGSLQTMDCCKTPPPPPPPLLQQVKYYGVQRSPPPPPHTLVHTE
jgi:hypothetical protein